MIILVNLDSFKPIIHILNYEHVISRKETEDISLSYNVSAHPAFDMDWWKSIDGANYELITPCSVKTSQSCKETPGTENITKTSFSLKGVQYPKDNAVFYKLNASNNKGNDSKTFQVQVLGEGNDVNYFIAKYD